MPHANRLYLWGMTVILLLGFAARVVNLWGAPPGLQHDELFIANDAIRTVTQGDWRLFYATNQGREGLYIWLLGGVYTLLGKHIIMLKVLPWFAGLLTMALTYRIVGRMWSRMTGVLASGLIAFTFFVVLLNRLGLRANLLLPLVLLVVWQMHVLYIHRQDRGQYNWRTAGWLGVLLGMGVYTYTAAWALPVALVLFNGVLLLIDRVTLRATWKQTGVALLIGGVLALPMVITRMTDSAGLERINNVATPVQALAQAGDLRPLATNALQLAGMAAFTGDPEWRYNIAGRALFPLPVGVLFYAGLLLGFVDGRHRRRLALWLCVIVAGLTPALVTDAAPSFLRAVVALPGIVAVLSYGVYRLVQLVTRSSTQPTQRWMIAASVVVVGIVAVTDSIALHRTYADVPDVYGIYRDDLEQLASTAVRANVPVVAASTFAARLDAMLYDYYRQGEQTADMVFFEGATAMVLPENGDGLLLYDSQMTPVQGALREWLNIARATGSSMRPILNQRNAVIYQPYVLANSDAIETRIADNAAVTTPDGSAYPLRFGDLLVLEAVVLPSMELDASAARLPLSLLLHPQQNQVTEPYKLFVHLLDSDGQLIAQRDVMGVHPSQWHPQTRFVQANDIPLPDELAPGTYTLRVGLYNEGTGDRVPIVAADETTPGDSAVIGRVRIIAPE